MMDLRDELGFVPICSSRMTSRSSISQPPPSDLWSSTSRDQLFAHPKAPIHRSLWPRRQGVAEHGMESSAPSALPSSMAAASAPSFVGSLSTVAPPSTLHCCRSPVRGLQSSRSNGLSRERTMNSACHDYPATPSTGRSLYRRRRYLLAVFDAIFDGLVRYSRRSRGRSTRIRGTGSFGKD